MARPTRRGPLALRQAFDELRFGPGRTLNLRESLPTAQAAVARAEAWLRQAQVDRAEEVLIVTGRGNQSDGGVPVVRQAIVRLLLVLKRRGVISAHREHTAGSFIVTLAPVRALWESPRRNRGRSDATTPASPRSLDALDEETRGMLRELAERSLHELGVKGGAEFLESEMLRQFSAMATSVGTGPDRERRLRAAIRTALDQRD